MAKYRKRPVVIEALQWQGNNRAEIETFVGQTLESKFNPDSKLTYLMIPTLESPHEASVGDFIIMGVSGEFYPCKPDIFEKTYERVD